MLLQAGACGSPDRGQAPVSPAAPDPPVVAPRTTSYTGHYRMTSCLGCDSWGGTYWRFTLTVSQVGDTCTARMSLEPWMLQATLTGVRRSDGALDMTGTAGPVSSLVLGAEFKDVVVREDPALGLVGTFTYTTLAPTGPGATILAEIPSATSGQAPPIAGTAAGFWTGDGRDDQVCQSDWGCGAPTFGLQIVEEAGSYKAFWDYKGRGGRIALALAGTKADSGDLVFQGSLPGPADVTNANVAVQRLAVRVDPSGVLTGDYDYTQDLGYTARRFTGALLSGTRSVVTLSPGPFEGEWEGRFVERTCVGDCPYFHVSTGGLELALNQVGAAVTGEVLREFPVSGTASGTSLVLEGGRENPGCTAKHGGTCSEHLRIVVTSIDRWGVMSGTAEHTDNGPYERSTLSGELWCMTRQIPKY